MKRLILFAAVLLAPLTPIALHAAAPPPTTYVVIKATASLPGVFQDATNQLVKTTLNTKMMINIAQGKDVMTPIAPNVILGYAFDFAALGQHNPQDPNGKAQVVVFQVDPTNPAGGTKLATIGTLDARTLVENQVFNKFRRALTSRFSVSNTGGTSNTFTSGTMVGGGTGTRTPNSPDPATVATVKITAPMIVTGFMKLSYTKNSQAVMNDNVLVISKGAVIGSGLVVGSFTE